MIPIFNLKRQYENLKDEISRAINSVLETGVFILADNVKNFEINFSKYSGVKYGVGVASGTDAILLSLKSLGIGSGDEVITVTNTTSPTVVAIIHTGAKPVIVDCRNDYNIDISAIEEKITKRTKAILPVHLYGLPCDMKELKEICDRHNLYLIEDCAQAAGSGYNGKKVGCFGDIGCFSFYPTKNLGAYGDGGMILTNNEKIKEKLLMLRMYGQKENYNSLIVGYNSRLDELQAAILEVKLKYLDGWVKRRREIAKLYNNLLKGVEFPEVSKNKFHSHHLYVIRSEKRDLLIRKLNKEGIGNSIHYPHPIHLQPAFRYLGYKEGDFLLSEEYSQKILSLPMFPELTNNEIETVAKVVNSI